MNYLKVIWKWLAAAALAVADWVGDRIQDLSFILVILIRKLPVRIARLATSLARGAWGLATFIPKGLLVLGRQGPGAFGAWAAAGFLRALAWLLTTLSRGLDLVGIPELLALFIRATTRATPLTGEEIGLAAQVLGPNALRFGDIRVAEGGVLRLIFARNGDRAFATFHTVNLPPKGYAHRSNFAILLHELVHVLQYEHAGSLYMGEALRAQATEGYGYGGPNGLRQARAAGKAFRNFNREQQAQIVEDYYLLCLGDDEAARQAYEPFVAELRHGKL